MQGLIVKIYGIVVDYRNSTHLPIFEPLGKSLYVVEDSFFGVLVVFEALGEGRHCL